MLPEERSKLRALSQCTMRVASYEKRFVRDLVSAPSEVELTPKQKRLLDNLYWRYRKQINAMIDSGRIFARPIEPPLIVIEESQEHGEPLPRFEIGNYQKAKAVARQLERLAQWQAKVNGDDNHD